MPAMLQLENISTHYGAICAVDSVSLHVNQGEIVSLIGSNGAGKTSLLMTVCGNPRASSGRISFEGEDIRSEEHTSELQSQSNLVCRLLLEKKKKKELVR